MKNEYNMSLAPRNEVVGLAKDRRSYSFGSEI